MIAGTIRPLALCIIQNQNKILVMNGYDPKKDQLFFRLLGGGIEFGEQSEQALRREFQEELATDLENVEFVTIIENIFTFNGNQGHEIALIFKGNLSNKDLSSQEEMRILDSESETASWQKISDFKDKKLILYPDGILEYL